MIIADNFPFSDMPVIMFKKQEKTSIHAQIKNIVFEDEYTEFTRASERERLFEKVRSLSESDGRIHFVRKAIISEESESETKIMTPALKEESIIVPTAPITNAGPALTEERAILLASGEEILFLQQRSTAIEQPTGNPPKSPKRSILPAVPERLKTFLKKTSVFCPRNSTAPLFAAKVETTIKGKSDGTIVPADRRRPFIIPSDES